MPGLVSLRIAVVSLLGSVALGQALHAAAEDKSVKGVQLPPPPATTKSNGGGSGGDGHNEIMLEEQEEAPSEESSSAQKGNHDSQRKGDVGHAETDEHVPGETQAGHEEDHDKGKKSEKVGNFGESLVEAQVDAKSVSSGAGLVWFGAVFVVLIALIYFLT